ncbi:MAG TPA: phospholipase D-like domain-containing protein [Steroidobacteraceae bacterium]|nr:phospholipase D-like domain-containing protein [Steroidobacteraceae bacterium]
MSHLSLSALVGSLFVVIYIGGAVAAALHALLTKSDPRSAIGWIAMCWLFPLGGSLLYWLFGINRVVTHSAQALPNEVERNYGRAADGGNSALAALSRVGYALTRLPLLAGNSLEPLHNGEVAFPLMLRAIAEARQTIWLATYIFQTDAVGQRFVAALHAAVGRGVGVRVLVDGIGEWYDWPHVVPQLRRAAIRAERFLPPRLIPPNVSLNCRNHRKLLVIDAQQAFMGGMNLGGREVGGSMGRRMTDIHFCLRGPIVAQLADVFASDWKFACGEQLPVTAPPIPVDQTQCRVITGGPDESVDKLLLVILNAIAVAQRQILIMTPYFIPPPELVAALQGAALRGVEVSLVIPRHSNLRYIDWATLHWLPALVERGVGVHLPPPPFSHAKLFVIDGEYAHIGSVNLDTRSLRLNFEIAVEVFDSRLCRQLGEFICEVRDRAAALSPADLQHVQPLARIRNSLCWLISPYL